MTIRRQLLNFGDRSTDFRMGCGAFGELPKLLGGAVGKPVRAYVLRGADVDEGHVETVRRALVDAGFSVGSLSVEEENACSLPSVARVFAELETFGLTGDDLLVGLGGSAVCSLASFCAAMWMGRVACALIPTTLDAMITSSTAMDGFSASSDSGLPSLSLRPEAALVVCDLDLVCGAPIEQNGMGYVRMVASHLCESRKAWEGFESHIEGLTSGSELAYLETIGMSLTSRLNTAKSASPAARKAFMYGETTARALRSCLGCEVPAYRLLAEGLRFEARLGVEVFDFSVDAMFAQDDYLEDLGVEELSFDLDVTRFIEALKAERLRYANRFQIAVPKNLGIIRLTGIDDEVLERHARAFLESRRA